MRSHIIQTNFTNGVVAPEYRANTQDENYYKSIQIGENVVVTPTGGLKRRGGLEKFIDETDGVRRAGSEILRIEPFFINELEKFIISFQVSSTGLVFIGVYDSDGVRIELISAPLTYTPERVKQFDTVQAVETMFFAHSEVQPYTLTRTNGVWRWMSRHF